MASVTNAAFPESGSDITISKGIVSDEAGRRRNATRICFAGGYVWVTGLRLLLPSSRSVHGPPHYVHGADVRLLYISLTSQNQTTTSYFCFDLFPVDGSYPFRNGVQFWWLCVSCLAVVWGRASFDLLLLAWSRPDHRVLCAWVRHYRYSPA